jgi:hypothetical protein
LIRGKKPRKEGEIHNKREKGRES